MESDVPRLLAKFESGALRRPTAARPNVVDLAGAVWSAAGVPGLDLTPAARTIEAQLGGREHLVFVLADGLGMQLLESMPSATYLWTHLDGTLDTVFPSTTAVALTTFATAAWPAAHGVVGHYVHLDGVGVVTPLLGATRSDGRPVPEANGDGRLFLVPSLASRVPRPALSVLPAAVVNSPFTAYATAAPRVGYRSLNEAADLAIDFIQAAREPTFTYLYVSRIDETVHELGPLRLEAVGAVGDLAHVMARLAAAVGARARIVLTADHGHLAVRPSSRRVIRGVDDLAGMLAGGPTGDARTVFFHLQPGALEAFADRFRERFGVAYCLLTPDEVEDLHLLGPAPLAAETKRRLGDAVAISFGDDTLEVRPKGAPADRRLAWPSHHSGLTAAEVRVPLVIV
ncbi:MAG TPA: alkaline phosphatase family protein [Dehalococcoidia bacterium]|nr:alkaline phosphatase family protein [Dehalococcoidia bacterium]